MLNLEEGKFYKTRDGEVVGPMVRSYDPSYPWTTKASPTTWTKTGRLFLGDFNPEDQNEDIVEEWVDPVEEPCPAQVAVEGSPTPEPFTHGDAFDGMADLMPDQILGNAPPDLPDNNPKTTFGRAKPPLHAIPPSALLHLGLAMENGETKYGLFNWREKKVSSSVYYDAALRHLLSWWDGETRAADSGVHHLGHVMACCAILLDAEATGNLNDDRGFVGKFAEVVEEMRKARLTSSV